MDNSLVSGRFDPTILLANSDHLRYLPTRVVRDTEPFEFAFLVEIVDNFESLFVRSRTIRSIFARADSASVSGSRRGDMSQDLRRYHISIQSVLIALSWISMCSRIHSSVWTMGLPRKSGNGYSFVSTTIPRLFQSTCQSRGGASAQSWSGSRKVCETYLSEVFFARSTAVHSSVIYFVMTMFDEHVEHSTRERSISCRRLRKNANAKE